MKGQAQDVRSLVKAILYVLAGLLLVWGIGTIAIGYTNPSSIGDGGVKMLMGLIAAVAAKKV